jgi:hypothetical protein
MNRVHDFARRSGIWLAMIGLIILFVLASIPPSMLAAGPRLLQSFDVSSSAPRAVEPTTALAIQRDYVHAWQSLASALEENRSDLLGEDFIGGAQQQWQEAIRAQQQNGLSRRIVDHGHHVRVSFYSPDGSSLEALDTADLEIEYREGSRVLSTEHVQAHYMVLFTPAENSWKVRILQELPPS